MAAKKSKEKPQFWGIRMYKRHIAMVRTRAKKDRVSQSEVVRRSIEQYVA